MSNSLAGTEQTGQGAWRDLLRRHAIRPDKQLGQSFLFDPGSLDKIVAAADLSGGELVLEIGAGVGSLTRALARRVDKVVAVEFDRRLLPALQEALQPFPNVVVETGDFLSMELPALIGSETYSVVANIPYNITSAVIRKLMEAQRSPELVVLTVQKEVAQRIVAGPGDMSLLALSVQLYGTPSIEALIPRGAFYPSPDVDSAVLRIELHQELPLGAEQTEQMFSLARAGFQQKRKQLRNSLGHGTKLTREQVDQVMQAADLSPKRRPQALRVEDWIRLTKQFQAFAAGVSEEEQS